MTHHDKFKRVLWFDSQVKHQRHPNAGNIAAHFEVSLRTAQRDIGYLRDDLNAPLHFNRSKNGYCYTDETFSLPACWLNEDNVIALALSARLASTIPDKEIKNDLSGIIQRVLCIFSSATGLNTEALSEKVSVKNVEYAAIDEQIFHAVVKALFDACPISITYYSPHKNQTTERTIMPLHLMHYMGSWHLIAFCSSRKDLRNFSISRIKSIQLSDRIIKVPKSIGSIKNYIRRHFGIMQGGRTQNVRLKISSSIAAWVSEQIWHPEQKMTYSKDGSIELSLPVGDFREIRRRILSYGADIEVLEPRELKKDIKNEILRMAKNI
ncbi:MAG: WYL domain-containing protein [Dissulfurispiraceae bacterium]|jgi:predicted DNA-binding transcriptional regulator YafY|nr:WYL domain-containing protein [Dissulfurispiraceae bacterium]